MTERQTRWLAYALLVIAVLVAGYLGVQYPMPAPPEEAKAVERGALLCASEEGNCVESWNGSDFYIYSDGGSTQTYHVDGATGNVDAEGSGDFASSVTVGTTLGMTAQTAISVTQDAIITATGTTQLLESAGDISTASIYAGTAGDMLVLINTVDTSITLSDTGTLKLSGDTALGQYDSIILWSDGTNWVEVGQANN